MMVGVSVLAHLYLYTQSGVVFRRRNTLGGKCREYFVFVGSVSGLLWYSMYI